MKLRPKSLTKKQAERAERIRRQYEADAHRRGEAPNQKKLDAALDAKGLIPWRRRCSILVPSPENLGQVRWEGTCRRCRKEKYLVIIERKKGKPDHYRKEGMFCGCAPVAGDNIQVESTNAAVNLLRDWDSAYRNTTVVSKSSMTLSTYITEKWIPARKTNPNVAGSTFRVDQQRAGYIIKDPIGAIRLQAITGTDAQAFLNRVIEEVGEESVKRIFGVLKLILSDAQAAKYIAANPVLKSAAPKLELPRETGTRAVQTRQRRMQRYWTPRQVQAFVALFYLLEAEALPPHYALFATGILLGLRPGELCALQWCDLSADGTKLRVWRSITEEQVKNREKDPELPRFTLGLAKERTDDWMDLPDVLQQILKRHREEAGVCEEGWIFPNDSGSYLTPVALRGRWYATQKRKGGWVKTGGYYTIQALVLEHTAGKVDLHYITPYGYRHTAATYELNTGGDSTSAARLLRHSRSTGTQLIDRNYGEILAERAEARLARVNEGFAALRKVLEKDAA